NHSSDNAVIRKLDALAFVIPPLFRQRGNPYIIFCLLDLTTVSVHDDRAKTNGGSFNMKGRLVTLLLASTALVASAVPLLAHHSFAAEFDSTKTVSFDGVVTKVEWTNPHVYFWVDVKDTKTGKVANWGCEMGSPNGLTRQGWTRSTLKV